MMKYEEVAHCANLIKKADALQKAIKFLQGVHENEELRVEGRERCTGENQRAYVPSGAAPYLVSALETQIMVIKEQLHNYGMVE